MAEALRREVETREAPETELVKVADTAAQDRSVIRVINVLVGIGVAMAFLAVGLMVAAFIVFAP